ncbi:MAG: hypothetical protein HY794_01965 [Desulfarculus sp.]|nr:hypothetical protein [Desulfarculus sp.]
MAEEVAKIVISGAERKIADIDIHRSESFSLPESTQEYQCVIFFQAKIGPVRGAPWRDTFNKNPVKIKYISHGTRDWAGLSVAWPLCGASKKLSVLAGGGRLP